MVVIQDCLGSSFLPPSPEWADMEERGEGKGRPGSKQFWRCNDDDGDDDEYVENGEVGDDSEIHDDYFNINDNDRVGNYEKQELIKGGPRTQNFSFPAQCHGGWTWCGVCSTRVNKQHLCWKKFFYSPMCSNNS